MNKIFGGEPFSSSCSFAFSLTFFPFLTSQTPFEDDNSEDERLETFPPLRRRLLGVGSEGNDRGSMFFTQVLIGSFVFPF